MSSNKMKTESVPTLNNESLNALMQQLNKLSAAQKLLVQQKHGNDQEGLNAAKAEHDKAMSTFYNSLNKVLASPVPEAPSRPRIPDAVRLAARNLLTAVRNPKDGIRSEVESLCRALDGEGIEKEVQAKKATLNEDAGKFSHRGRYKLANKRCADMSRTERVVSSSSSSREEHLEPDEAAFDLNKDSMKKVRRAANKGLGCEVSQKGSIKGFDGIDKKVDDTDKKVDGTDEKIDGIDKEGDVFNKGVDGIDKKIDNTNKKVGDADKEFDGIDGKVDGINKGVDDTDKGINVGIEGDVV